MVLMFLTQQRVRKKELEDLLRCMLIIEKKLISLEAGELGAVIGLKNTTTGDTLCTEDNPIILESMDFPDPVINVAIEPKTKAGQEKMGISFS